VAIFFFTGIIFLPGVVAAWATAAGSARPRDANRVLRFRITAKLRGNEGMVQA
jgi:hypothetical protein